MENIMVYGDIVMIIKSATIYEHAEQVTQRTISNKKTQEILNYFK
jgi:hypothetical protein